jgi:hypothetical protein
MAGSSANSDYRKSAAAALLSRGHAAQPPHAMLVANWAVWRLNFQGLNLRIVSLAGK